MCRNCFAILLGNAEGKHGVLQHAYNNYLLATVTFSVMETVTGFVKKEDWMVPLQVYCPPCEVRRGENVILCTVDRSVFVVVAVILPFVEVTGWPLESIH